MNDYLTIGDLGKAVGLPSKTIRFYEEIGLIEKPVRSENGYRSYNTTVVDELRLIKHARDIGLPIPQIKSLMVGCVGADCAHTKAHVQTEISNYIEVLENKIAELTNLKQQLSQLSKNVNQPQSSECFCCNILGQLMDIEKGGGTK